MALKAVNALPQSVFNIQSKGINDYLQGDATCIYPHQRDAVKDIRTYFTQSTMDKGGINVGMVVLPTGCGKTGVAVLAPYALNAHRVLVITPSVTISHQISDAFGGNAQKCFLIKRGIINDTNENRQAFIPFVPPIKTSRLIEPALSSPIIVVNAHKIGGKSRVAIEDIPVEGFDLVIVDEAHHYPTETWRLLINHFLDQKVRCLFLTATPNDRNGKPLTYMPFRYVRDRSVIPICYELNRVEAVRRGVIRDIKFEEIGQLTDGEVDAMRLVADRIKETLREHDKQDPFVKHQAMVLTQQKENLNGALDFERIYGDDCKVFITSTKNEVLESFNRHQFSTLIIIGRLLEGYDNHNVSVVAIVRNVAPTSRVLFTQFVGRAVRKAHVDRPGGPPDDPVTAVLISHISHNQKPNYDNFDRIAEDDLIVDDD